MIKKSQRRAARCFDLGAGAPLQHVLQTSLAFLALFSAVLFLFQGAYVLRPTMRSASSRAFALLCFAFALWALAFAFFVGAPTQRVAWVFWKASAVGWAVGPAVLWHFLVLLTEERGWLADRRALALAYVPGLIFFAKALLGQLFARDLVRTPLGWDEVIAREAWTYAYLAYYSGCSGCGLFLVYRWGRRASHVQQRAQARVILRTGIPVLLVVSASNVGLRWLEIHRLPGLAPVLLAAWGFGIWYAIVKYRLLAITSATAARDILRAMSEGMLLLGADDRVVEANRAARTLLGQSAHALRGQRLGDLIPGMAPLIDAFISGRVPSCEVSTHVEGRLRLLAVSGSPVNDAFGQRAGGVVLLRDITDRRRSDEALRHSEQRYRELAELLPAAICELDAEGRLTFANRGFAELTGWSREQATGQHYAAFLAPADHDRAAAAMAALGAGERRPGEELELRRADGSTVLAVVHNAPILRAGVFAGMRAVAVDITERKRLEAQLLEANKLEAVGQLAGGVAHDFNNLLAAILGYAELLRLDGAPGSLAREAGEVIGKAAQRGSELTGQLLGFARRGKHQNAPVDLHRVIREVARLLERTLDRNIRIDLQLDAPEATVLGDPGQLHQVLLNLAVNARDAMAQGGVLTFRSARLAAAGDDGLSQQVQVSVIDTGCGIPEAIRQRIFEPFFTTKPRGQGTGMGLAMAYGIVKNHGGEISVRSTVGQGTTMEILLPLPAQKRKATPTSTSFAALRPGRGRVLLVDDEPLVRQTGRAMLQRLGYEVLEAADGAEAVERYRARSQPIDVVLLDLVMPTMAGRECMAALQALDPAVKVLVSTGYGRDGRVQELLDAGALGFVAKPYMVDDLAALLREALESRPMPEGSAEAPP
jgi:PAS domain S-box-containing protein